MHQKPQKSDLSKIAKNFDSFRYSNSIFPVIMGCFCSLMGLERRHYTSGDCFEWKDSHFENHNSQNAKENRNGLSLIHLLARHLIFPYLYFWFLPSKSHLETLQLWSWNWLRNIFSRLLVKIAYILKTSIRAKSIDLYRYKVTHTSH